MNIQQTRQVLSYIWSTHPSAPKFSDDGKTRMIASYFRVLYQYSLEDVMAAVDLACRESPSFIPSAYDIEKKCTKHLDVERYLPSAYEVIRERLEEAENKRLELENAYREAFRARDEIMRDFALVSFADKERQTAREAECRQKCAPYVSVIDAYCEISDECRSLKARMDELYKRATWEASDAYDQQQAQLAHRDLCSLGYERLALEG